MTKLIGDPGYRPQWCIHYRHNLALKPNEPDTCKAGVDFTQFESAPYALRPCFLTDKAESKPSTLPCASLRRPTPDEILAHDAWVEQRNRAYHTVLAAIKPWRKAHQGLTAQETIPCPACGGNLHLDIQAHNNRVIGWCEGDGCVAWME